MERLTTDYGVVLTYRDSVLNEIDEQDYVSVTKEQLNIMLEALRKQAKRNGWKYNLMLCPSISNPRNMKKERLHIHVIVRGNPGATIIKWLKKYWHKKYGIVNVKKLYNSSGFAGYMKSQAMYTINRSLDFQTFDVAETVENACVEAETELCSPLIDIYNTNSTCTEVEEDTVCVNRKGEILWAINTSLMVLNLVKQKLLHLSPPKLRLLESG
jgi:hypothetical protein